MSARNEENEQADDVATLYSWANLHGAKYRDFSASRQEMRAQMRQRTLAEQAKAAREEAQKPAAGKEDEGLWDDVLPSIPRQKAILAARGDALAAARREASGEENDAAAFFAEEFSAGMRPAGAREAATREAVVRQGGIREAAPEAALPRHALPIREQHAAEPRVSSGRVVETEAGPPVRPAWLGESRAPIPVAVTAETQEEEETLQQSRERVASRWFALRGIFGKTPEEAQAQRIEGQAPVLTVFSLAGGVGKTSLMASVARALAARGERVLLADTCSFGVLPYYFGAREVKPGVVRTFSGGTSDPPIKVLTLDAEREGGDADLLRRELVRGGQDATRVLIDVATGSASMLRQALRFSPTVLVPVVPDMASLVTLQALEAFFRNQESVTGQALHVWYVLNQFDPSLPLHLDVREVLRQQLGERLLPFAVHRSTAVSEALAEGMTVIDYAPNSPATEDIVNLVTWVRNTSVVAAGGARAMRWSER